MAAQYEIDYAEVAADEIEGLRVFDQRKIIKAIEQHLRYRPWRVSQTRIKLMVPPFGSQYRLRVGDFRIYYDVDEAARRVTVLRVLFKGTSQISELPT